MDEYEGHVVLSKGRESSLQHWSISNPFKESSVKRGAGGQFARESSSQSTYEPDTGFWGAVQTHFPGFYDDFRTNVNPIIYEAAFAGDKYMNKFSSEERAKRDPEYKKALKKYEPDTGFWGAVQRSVPKIYNPIRKFSDKMILGKMYPEIYPKVKHDDLDNLSEDVNLLISELKEDSFDNVKKWVEKFISDHSDIVAQSEPAKHDLMSDLDQTLSHYGVGKDILKNF